MSLYTFQKLESVFTEFFKYALINLPNFDINDINREKSIHKYRLFYSTAMETGHLLTFQPWTDLWKQ